MSDAPLIATLALSLGALGRFAWPPNGKRRELDLVIGLVSLGIGIYAGGALLGFVLPVLAIVGALIIGSGLRPNELGAAIEDGTAALSAPGVGRDVTQDRPLGASTFAPGRRAFLPFAVLALAAVALLVFAMTHLVAGKYSWLLGGVPRAGAPSKTFEALIRQLGFGLFPWSAVAIFALARPLTRLDGEGPATNTRLAFVSLYLLLFAGLGFAVSGYLQRRAERRPLRRAAGDRAGAGRVLRRGAGGKRRRARGRAVDGDWDADHRARFLPRPRGAGVRPPQREGEVAGHIQVGQFFMVFGFIVAAGVYGGLAARSRALGKVAGPDPASLRPTRRFLDRSFVLAGRYGLQIAIGCAVLFAFYLAQGLVPRLSTHLSFKPVLESYAKFAHEGEKIRQVPHRGTRLDVLQQADDGRIAVAGSRRAVPARSRPRVRDGPDRRAGGAGRRVQAGARPLLRRRRVVVEVLAGDEPARARTARRQPAGEQRLDGAGGYPSAHPPWSWRVPLSATFGDAVELVGADYPTSVRRPGKIPLDLFFRVKAKVPGSYKIFLHFDGPAAPRVIGDHDPVNHAFGTSYWLPGESVRDHYETDVPLMTTPAGTYTIYMGFWPGGEGKRLKVTQGNHDGADRIRLGTIEIK